VSRKGLRGQPWFPLAMPDMSESTNPRHSPKSLQGALSPRPRRRWALWLMMVGVTVLVVSALAGIALFTWPLRFAATTDTTLRPQAVAKAIAVAIPCTYLAILAGLIGVGMLVAGAIAWFRR
jgi:uncharacterized membrane protein